MANMTNANAGILITIPANSTWRGSVGISATLTVAIGGSAATQYPSVTVSGSGGTWRTGDTVVGLALATPAVAVTALAGLAVTASMSTGDIQVQTRANPVDLVLNIGPGVTGIAMATGQIC